MDALRVLEDSERQPGRVLRDRLNPIESFVDEEFVCRFRFRKEAVVELFEKLKNDPCFDVRGQSVAPLLQLFTALRFFATRNFQITDGDLMGLHQATVCRIVHTMYR